MTQTGYVITRAKNLKEYFTTSSAYDAPSWVELTEATEFPTAELAHVAAKKLWMKGNFSAKVIPISELTIDDLRDLMGKQGVTDQPHFNNKDSYDETDPLAVDDVPTGSESDLKLDKDDGCECICPGDEETDDEMIDSEMGDRPEGDINMSLELPSEEDDIEIKRGMRESAKIEKTFARKVEAYINKRFYVFNDKVSGDDKIHYVIEESKAKYDIRVNGNAVTVTPNLDTGATVERAKDIKVMLVDAGKRGIRIKESATISGRGVTESDDVILTKAAKEVVRGANLEATAKKYDLIAGELKGEVNLVRDLINTGRGHLIGESSTMPKKPQLDAKSDDKRPGLIPNLKSGDDVKLKDPTVPDKKASSDFSYAGSMEHDEKVKVPSDIKSSLDGVIAKFRKCSDANVSNDDRASFCLTVVGALETIAKDLDVGTVGGIKQAQIHMSSYMNPITSHIPADVAKFIMMGGKKPSLKDLFDDKRTAKDKQ